MATRCQLHVRQQLLQRLVGHSHVVRYLVDHGADVEAADAYDNSPLMIAITANRPDVVMLLVEKGADTHATSVYGESMLMLACIYRRLGITKFLLGHGANPNEVDRGGHHLLCISEPCIPLMQLLLDHGADINMPIRDGSTLLYVATLRARAQKSDPRYITWLLDHGADVNLASTAMGETPLMAAALSVDVDLTRLLLERGADVTQLNREGRSVLDLLGESWKYRRMLKLCKQYLDSNRPHEGLLLK